MRQSRGQQNSTGKLQKIQYYFRTFTRPSIEHRNMITFSGKRSKIFAKNFWVFNFFFNFCKPWFLCLIDLKSHQNHSKTESKWHQNDIKMTSNQIKVKSKSHQNHIKTTSKSHQIASKSYQKFHQNTSKSHQNRVINLLVLYCIKAWARERESPEARPKKHLPLVSIVPEMAVCTVLCVWVNSWHRITLC